nr:hypothetical protein [Mycobacterium sp.]
MTSHVSAYEQWVTAVRSWRQDPLHDMSQLPTLVVDSLPPAAFERLFSHIRDAQQHVMNRWADTFARDWGAARDEQGRVRALLDTRRVLARRLQLAGHPGLPEVVRAELTKGVARDTEQLQQELEEALTKQQRGARIDRFQTERALNVLRTNRLTAILEPGFSLQALFDGRIDVTQQQAVSAPLPAPGGHDPAPPVRRRRTIIIDNQP